MKNFYFSYLYFALQGTGESVKETPLSKIFPRRGQHRNPNPAAQKKTGLKNSPAGSVRLLPRLP